MYLRIFAFISLSSVLSPNKAETGIAVLNTGSSSALTVSVAKVVRFLA